MTQSDKPPNSSLDSTFIAKLKTAILNVPIDAEKDNAVGTTQFLDAAELLTTIFEKLGSLLNRVHVDMTTNIKKIRGRQLAAPLDSETIQALCHNELKTKKDTATEGLLWLVRALDFTCLALESDIDNVKDVELNESFKAAYEKTLSGYHNFIFKGLFAKAMDWMPKRDDFYITLSSDPKLKTMQPKTELDKKALSKEVQEALRPALPALRKIVNILKAFLISIKMEK